jgi:K+-sensing histidine kinase KdpD
MSSGQQPARSGQTLANGWHKLIQPGISPKSPVAYLFAAACVALATALRFAFGWHGGDTLLFGSYYPAILTVTLICGAASGVFATILSLVVVWWAIIPPDFNLAEPTTGQIVGFAYFLAMAGITVLVAEAYRGSATRSPRAGRAASIPG